MMGISESERTILHVALAAVSAAGQVTRHVQHQLEAIRQHTKDDRSPVTVADYAAQAIIAHQLTAGLGQPLLVGEEDAEALRANTTMADAVTDACKEVWPTAARLEVLDAIDAGNHDASAESYWTLDPIDGTKGFLRRGQYAISLALIEHGEVKMGILGCPNLSLDFARPFDQPDAIGSTFFAARGHGAWVHSNGAIDGEAAPVVVAEEKDIANMRVCGSVEASHSRIDETQRIADYLGAKGTPAQLDSQCKYAVVARGQAHAYLRLPTQRSYVEKIWDHAAGKVIAEQAGAIVTDIRGKALDFSRGTTLTANRGVICATPEFHGSIIAAIEAMGLFEGY